MTDRIAAAIHHACVAVTLAALLSGCSMVAARKDRAETLRDPDGAFRLETKYLPFGTEALSHHTAQGSLYRLVEADGDVSELHTEANAPGSVSLRPLLEQFAARRLNVEHSEAAENTGTVPGAADTTALRGAGTALESGEGRVFTVMGCVARGRLFVFYREEKRLDAGKRMEKQPDEIRAHLAAFVRRFRWTKGE